MYRLIELIKQDEKESQAIYPFNTYTEAKGEYESKAGANMKSDAYSTFTLMVLDNEGHVCDVKHEGEELTPRLIEVKTTDTEENDIMKYATTELVEANFHSKWGSAIKNTSVSAEMLRGIDGLGGEVCSTYWVREETE